MKRPIRLRRLLPASFVLAAVLTAGCSTGEHHSSEDQTPPSMGDYNNPCNPHSKSHLGQNLPKKDLCYQQPNGNAG
jgi:hypothetical protein